MRYVTCAIQFNTAILNTVDAKTIKCHISTAAHTVSRSSVCKHSIHHPCTCVQASFILLGLRISDTGWPISSSSTTPQHVFCDSFYLYNGLFATLPVKTTKIEYFQVELKKNKKKKSKLSTSSPFEFPWQQGNGDDSVRHVADPSEIPSAQQLWLQRKFFHPGIFIGFADLPRRMLPIPESPSVFLITLIFFCRPFGKRKLG